MARPLKTIDADVVTALAKIHCTYEEIAAVVGCSTDTLKRRFADRIEKGREAGKASLRRLQFEKAEEGNPTMLIWLGKQHLGQADESRIKVGNLDDLSDDELKALASGKVPSP
jgi:AraC-like DNA-binding protein